MHFYGLNYRDAMDLPIRAFWFMNSSVVRLMAEQDIRALTVVSSAQATEAIRQTRESLVVEMGEVMKLDPIASAVRDENGFQDLKAMTQ